MADVELALAWLGLPQYLDRLVHAGFDSWDTLMEITEQDLETLSVELGHRRKLQREIANSRKLIDSSTQHLNPLLFPLQADQDGAAASGARPAQSPTDSLAVVPKKRAYVHHPKPDTNAPARPYSAYVLFAKAVREDLKSQRLSFTNISKEVGERWQRLTPEEKHGWRRQSATPREQYKSDLVKYHQSDHHRDYLQYLSEFASAQAARRPGGDPSPHRNAAAPPPKNGPRRLGKLPVTAAPPFWGRQAMTRIEADQGLGASPHARTRAIHACEPCRQRKVKCDGVRPSCGKCRHLNLTCSSGVSASEGMERAEHSLWWKVNAYETILYRLIPRVGDQDRAAIESILLTPVPTTSEEAFHTQPSEPNGDTKDDGGNEGVDGESDEEAGRNAWITPPSHPLLRLGIEKISSDTASFSHPSDPYPSPLSPDEGSTERISGSFSPTLSTVGPSTWQQQQQQEQNSVSYQQQQQQQQQQQDEDEDDIYYPGPMIFDDISAAERDDFGFLQDPNIVNFHPTS